MNAHSLSPHTHAHKHNNLLICVHVNMPLVSFERRGYGCRPCETISTTNAPGRFVWAHPPCRWRELETARQKELEERTTSGTKKNQRDWMSWNVEGARRTLQDISESAAAKPCREKQKDTFFQM